MDIAPGGSETISQNPLPSHGHTDKLFDLKRLHFPKYRHDHPPVINVNEVAEVKTVGQKVADWVANGMGSWNFIIGQSVLLMIWIILNSVGWWIWKWDSYPFIAMNLLLSCQAAYAAPVIMMSQNRQAEKDRLTAQNDYNTDCKGELEIRHIMDHLDHQDELILQLLQHMADQRKELMEHLTRLDPQLAQKLGGEIQQIALEDKISTEDF